MQNKPKPQLLSLTTSNFHAETIISSPLHISPYYKPQISLPIPSPKNDLPQLQISVTQTVSPRGGVRFSTKGHNVILNELNSILKKENIYVEPKVIDNLANSFDLKEVVRKLKDKQEVKPTTVRGEDRISNRAHNTYVKSSNLKHLAGKMYAKELWSKKQYMQMTHLSPTAARNDVLHKLGINSDSKEDEKSHTSIGFKLNAQKKVANNLFTKCKNGVSLTEKDVLVEPPLYEQVISTVRYTSPNEANIPSERQFLTRKASPFSPRESVFEGYEYSTEKTLEDINLGESQIWPKSPELPRCALSPQSRSSFWSKHKSKKLDSTKDEELIESKNYFKDDNRKLEHKKHELSEIINYGSTGSRKNITPGFKRHIVLDEIRQTWTSQNTSPANRKQFLSSLTERNNTREYPRDMNKLNRTHNISKISNPLNETQTHMDNLIDECKQFSNDQSLKRIIARVDDELSESLTPEQRRCTKEKRMGLNRQKFIDAYNARYRLKKEKAKAI